MGYPPKSVYSRLLGSYEMLRTSEKKAIQEKFAEFLWTYPGLVDTFPSRSDLFSRSSLLELSGA